MMTFQLTRAVRLTLLLLLPGAIQPSAFAASGPPTITNQPASAIVLQGDPATFRVGADGTAPMFYQWFRNGAALSLATNAAHTLPVTSAGDQGAVFTVRVSNALASVTSDPAVLTVDPGILATQTVSLVVMTNTWRYDQSGTDLGTAWLAPGYADAAWPAGPALLYVETAGLPAPKNTPLTIGRMTYYFRTRFNFSPPAGNIAGVSLVSRTIVDDGVVAHLNGAEALRLGVNPGQTYASTASRSVGDASLEGPFDLPTNGLAGGDNVLAAEVHQINSTSSDIVFGMTLDALIAVRMRDTQAPAVVSLVPAASETVPELRTIQMQFSEPVRGVDAADLRINGSAATSLITQSSSSFVFQFPPPPTGVVVVAWAPDHGITDLAVATNAFEGGGWTYVVDPAVPPARLIISEFMAANNLTLRDEDGAYSDWIELKNTSPAAVNLGGWYLTDDAHDLTQWRFPSTNLPPNGYLVVFASGKNRAISGRPLHTSFQLDSAGEYLALVRPDGVTIAHEFAPAYPAQVEDVSYGTEQVVSATSFLTNGATARWLVPRSAGELPADWAGTNFLDEAWASGPTGLGFDYDGANTDVGGLVRTDLSPAMWGTNASAFLRLPFVIAEEEMPALDRLTLRMKYDDGFAAHLNGVEVARRNAPLALAWNAAATAEHPTAAVLQFEDIDLTAFRPLLREGANVLAIQGLNRTAGDADFLVLPELVGQMVRLATDRFFAVPTPGGANSNAYLGFVADTQFSVDRGFYDAPVSVAITCATPGAVIRYTTNGTPPTATTGYVYASPLTIGATTVLRAAAFKTGWRPSNVDTHTYVFVGDVARQSFQTTTNMGLPAMWGGTTPDYGMDPDVVGPGDRYSGKYRDSITNDLRALPTLSIVMGADDLFGANGIYTQSGQSGLAWERPASAELIYSDGSEGFHVNCGLRIQGGAFRSHGLTLKHSFRLVFKDIYGPGKLDYPWFGDGTVNRFDDIILRANSNDGWQWSSAGSRPLYVRDEFARQALLATGGVAARGTFVHLYLNGVYWGLYNPTERPDAGFSAAYFGGEKDNWDAINSGQVSNGDLSAWNAMISLCSQGLASAASYQRIQGNDPDGTRNPAYPVYLDVDSLIDYMTVNLFAGNTDWPFKNYWVGRDRSTNSTGFKFYLWDTEWSMGIQSDLNTDRTGVSDGVAAPYAACKANPEFRVRFGDRAHRFFFNGGPYTVDPASPQYDPANPQRNRPAALLDRLAAGIERAVVGESARWGDQHTTAPPYTRDEHWAVERTNLLRNYFPQRSAVVLQQLRNAGLYPLAGAPTFSQLGGFIEPGFTLTLTQTNAGGVIFYTMDGTDPRLPGGGTNAGAQLYLGALPLDANVHLRARARAGTHWSALVEATFTTAQYFTPLAVTEIMFHPPAVGAVDGDEYEFLELKNTGTNTLNLSGLFFSGGISFTFTNGTRLGPGQFFVLARNRAQMALPYPGVTVHGIYSGKLDNAGETLTLSHLLLGEVLSLTYGDRAPWPVAPDGHGFSLVPRLPNANPDPDQAVHWRASAAPGGSPGADDPEPNNAPILVNEVLSASTLPDTDCIELFNPTATEVDLGGWFLTDDPGTPMKYRIPAGTMIAAGGTQCFTETDFNSPPDALNAFSLSAHGDEVYLFSGDASSHLTGYSHGFSFGPAAAGVSFGRHLTSTGEEQFPPQREFTPCALNRGPRVGPVVIHEIHYHPAEGEDEFVELKNLGTNAVTLFDPAQPTNTWKLAGLGYTFPTNLSLDPGQLLLLVPTNPAAFRVRYHVPAGVPVLGPYSGALQDSGERLELQCPDTPDTNGLVPITLDEVRYNDRLPWPLEADGNGPSLQRRTAAAYGNEPASWTAAMPTPGTEDVGGAEPSVVTPPQSQTVQARSDVTFTVVADGAAPLSYRWRRDRVLLPSNTNAALVLTNVQLAQAGLYDVVVFNGAGAVSSAAARLSVLPVVVFSIQPTNRNVVISNSVTFTTLAAGTGPVRYQWRFNGTDVPQATNASYTIPVALPSHSGVYTVLAADAVSAFSSDPAVLTVSIRPAILLHPLSQTVVEGGSVTFTVAASGSPPLGFRWRKGGATFTNGIVLSALTYSSLTLTNLKLTNAASYNVVVTNLAGQAPTSSNAVLTVLADSDLDGIPDTLEPRDGTADDDGDGMSNAAEYVAGTDDADPASSLRVETAAGLPATIWFHAVSNRTYTVQCTDSLNPSEWRRLADVLARPTNRVEVLTDPAPGPQRCYRVVSPLQAP